MMIIVHFVHDGVDDSDEASDGVICCVVVVLLTGQQYNRRGR